MTNFANLTATVDDEDLKSRHGEGISRPVPGEPTRLYRLRVRQPGVSPMKVQLYAESAAKALEYGKARWPNAVVTPVRE
jgi:hypothetical protein